MGSDDKGCARPMYWRTFQLQPMNPLDRNPREASLGFTALVEGLELAQYYSTLVVGGWTLSEIGGNSWRIEWVNHDKLDLLISVNHKEKGTSASNMGLNIKLHYRPVFGQRPISRSRKCGTVPYVLYIIPCPETYIFNRMYLQLDLQLRYLKHHEISASSGLQLGLS